MKTALSLLLWLSLSTVYAQTFKKYQVNETGCYVYLPADPGTYEMSYSDDSAKVYTNEVSYKDFNFGVIVVEFSENLGDTKEGNQDLLMSYLDFLQGQFGVTSAAGYGKGHTLESNPNASGIIDYWEDSDGLQYAVKGWVDNTHLAVLFLYGAGEYPTYGEQEMFLNGFRFPERN